MSDAQVDELAYAEGLGQFRAFKLHDEIASAEFVLGCNERIMNFVTVWHGGVPKMSCWNVSLGISPRKGGLRVGGISRWLKTGLVARQRLILISTPG